MNTQRPLSVAIAAILLALLSVLIDLSFPLWADAIPRDDGGAPAFVFYLTVVVGVVGLIGAAGLWMLRRWGIWLAIVVRVLNFLDAMSGQSVRQTPRCKSLPDQRYLLGLGRTRGRRLAPPVFFV